jgi:DNA replication protein DnaC
MALMYNSQDLPLVRNSWFRLANIPAKVVGWRLDDCVDTEHEVISHNKSWLNKVKSGQVIRAYGNVLCGKGLLFHGSSGGGKSTLAAALLQEAITRFPLESFNSATPVLARPCYFTSYVNLVALKGAMISNNFEEKDFKLWHGVMGDAQDDAFNIRILVIDDVAKEHSSVSGWEKNVLHEILRNRFEKGLPTIVTTNLAPEDWEGMYGPATRSFIEESFIHLNIKSSRGDLRLTRAKPSSNPSLS